MHIGQGLVLSGLGQVVNRPQYALKWESSNCLQLDGSNCYWGLRKGPKIQILGFKEIAAELKLTTPLSSNWAKISLFQDILSVVFWEHFCD